MDDQIKFMTGLIVSYKTYAKHEDKSAFYFFPTDSNEIIALPLFPDRSCPEKAGYLMINGKYIKCLNIG